MRATVPGARFRSRIPLSEPLALSKRFLVEQHRLHIASDTQRGSSTQLPYRPQGILYSTTNADEQEADEKPYLGRIQPACPL